MLFFSPARWTAFLAGLKIDSLG
ncbi:DUF397 domain-containing protein [Micromonospora sp. NPDC049559]